MRRGEDVNIVCDRHEQKSPDIRSSCGSGESSLGGDCDAPGWSTHVVGAEGRPPPA
ncbi:hypothetical protein NY08_1096 [Rhodococcus sp. B7740]|nr:hypothetical protein NY08_1096 [Rhodococcus sp. B7740]